MSQKSETTRGHRGRRRTFLWVAGSAAVVTALLYWEQAALLYVLSTLAMCTLLFVVAFSDLEGVDKKLTGDSRSVISAEAVGGEAAAVPETPQAAGARTGKSVRTQRRRPLETGGVIK